MLLHKKNKGKENKERDNPMILKNEQTGLGACHRKL